MLGNVSLLPWTGVYVLLLATVVGVWRVLPGIISGLNERQRDKASEKSSDWTRLRDEVDRLSARVEALEHKVEECEEREEGWRRRAISAEADNARLLAIQQGQGEVRQAAANAAAEQRLDTTRAPTAAARFSKDKSG